MNVRAAARRWVVALSGRLPGSLRRAWIGDSAHPRRLATVIHDLLDTLGEGGLVTLPCHGALEGYQMTIDWNRHRHYANGSWEPEVVEALRQNVPPGGTVLDVGAHVGFFTLLLSRLVGPGGLVLALEPVPENRALLEANVLLNGCRNVRVIGEAAGAVPGTMSLGLNDDDPYPGTGSIVRAGRREVTTRVTTVDDLVRTLAGRVDVLKIDVEGAEADVLAGAAHVMVAQRPAMVVELHGDPRASGRAVQLLRQAGYRVRQVDREGPVTHVLAQ